MRPAVSSKRRAPGTASEAPGKTKRIDFGFRGRSGDPVASHPDDLSHSPPLARGRPAARHNPFSNPRAT